MQSWTPQAEGRGFEFTPTLKPLEPYRSHVTVISGLAQDNGRAKGSGPRDHARAAASYLTGAHPLDHVTIMYGSGLSCGNRHWHHDLPIVLAGGASGTIRTGCHIRLPGEVPLNNLFLSMLDRSGANVDILGDSSGRLTVH